MATYTSGKSYLIKPAYGEYASAADGWTTPVNANWDSIDTMLNGSTTLTSSGSNIDISNAATDVDKYRMMRLNVSSATADVSVILPKDISGIWIAQNQSAKNITFKTAATGSTVVMPAGKRAMIYSDGTNITEANNFYLSSAGGTVTGATTFSGNVSVGGTFGATGASTFGGDVTVSTATALLHLSGASGQTLRMTNTSAAVGSQIWDLYTNATTFNARCSNGSGLTNDWLQVTRNGYTPSSITLKTGSGTGASVNALQIDSAANLKFNSGYGSAATAYGCRAWAAITGSSGAVRSGSSGLSCTRTGTGVYNITFPAMPDANYSASLSTESSAAYPDAVHLPFIVSGTRTTSSFQVRVNGATNVAVDPASLFVAIHR